MKTGDPDAYFGEMSCISDNEFGVTEVSPAKVWAFVSPALDVQSRRLMWEQEGLLMPEGKDLSGLGE